MATFRRIEVEDEPPAGVIRWLISCDEPCLPGQEMGRFNGAPTTQ